MKIEIRQVGTSSSQALIREHLVRIDRPVEKGGSDTGPMGGELFLAGVGGCFTTNLLAAIKARDSKISGVRTEVIATLAESPARFSELELIVSAECGDRDELRKLIDIADRACIIMNTLRNKLDLHVRVSD